ncbi:hypothetical protein V5O48_007610 [Marasmius crinis-equi]|uniref:Uncharacterized protein n=1 Tax=Marasmius crinis-equi TaxID=585013 RepID=A0ABR3FG76_9AGAR
MTSSSQTNLCPQILRPFVSAFMEEIEGSMARLVGGIPPTPSRWRCKEKVLANMTPEVRHFVEHELNIPALNDSSPDVPSLLIHGLGEGFNDHNRITRCDALFKKPGDHTLLINTSGAGKTRALLEALTINWGFYFTCNDPSKEGIGSSDLWETLGGLAKERGFREDFPRGILKVSEKVELKVNQRIAVRLFSCVLIARLLIFNWFLALVVDDARRTKTSFHRPYMLRWLELQVQPWILGSVTDPEPSDIFARLSERIRQANLTEEDEEEIFVHLKRDLFQLLPKVQPAGRPNIYMVIDEAQEAVKLHPNAFRNGDLKQRRPAIRELIYVWGPYIMHERGVKFKFTFVVTGTGLSLPLFQDALSSSTLKQELMTPFKKVGSFESQQQQQNYIRKFIPEVLLRAEVGQILLERMWYWLQGRFRLTAGFLTLLLQYGYQQPNALLDRYIKKFAGFLPTDCPQWALDKERDAPFKSWVEEPRFSYSTLDFERLKERGRCLIDLVTETAYEYMLTSETESSRTYGDCEALLVELGFARIPYFPAGSDTSKKTKGNRDDSKDDVAMIDERLVLSACAAWLNNYSKDDTEAADTEAEVSILDDDGSTETEDISVNDDQAMDVEEGKFHSVGDTKGKEPVAGASASFEAVGAGEPMDIDAYLPANSVKPPLASTPTSAKPKAEERARLFPQEDQDITSLYRWLSKRIASKNKDGIAFEEWILLYVILAFGTTDPTNPHSPPSRKLGQVFDFFDDTDEKVELLMEKRARIASVHFPERYQKLGLAPHESGHVVFRKDLRLEACPGALGFRSGNEADSLLQWVRGERREMFCFPGNLMGPDLVFCLELHDGAVEQPDISYIWVMVQTKAHRSASLRGEDTLSAVRSVTPSALYIDTRFRTMKPDAKLTETRAKQQQAKNASLLAGLEGLPDRERECAGKYSVLRVVTSWPAKVNFGNHILKRGEENAEGEKEGKEGKEGKKKKKERDIDGADNHPLACFNRQLMVDLTKNFSPTNILSNILNDANASRGESAQGAQKRKNKEEAPDDRIKRARA